GAGPNILLAPEVVADHHSNPSNGFSEANLRDQLNLLIEFDHILPDSEGPFDAGTPGIPSWPYPNIPVYVVVTPPNILSDSPDAAGYNDLIGNPFWGDGYPDDPHPDYWPTCWVSAGSNADNTVNVDDFSTTLSHELGEFMADFGAEGFEVNP